MRARNSYNAEIALKLGVSEETAVEFGRLLAVAEFEYLSDRFFKPPFIYPCPVTAESVKHFFKIAKDECEQVYSDAGKIKVSDVDWNAVLGGNNPDALNSFNLHFFGCYISFHLTAENNMIVLKYEYLADITEMEDDKELIDAEDIEECVEEGEITEKVRERLTYGFLPVAEKDAAQNYIIGVSGSGMDDVCVDRVYGTKRQVKEYLLAKVKAIRFQNEENDLMWDDGTTSVDEIEERENGKLYAYDVYADSHFDYTATPETEVEVKVLKC